ncbi:MAG: glycosyltransferase family 39 protein [Chloroflexi bacterium]|nr:glycosyltransferase family 39 protein [Chloroflexota bacterium]
MSVSSAISEPGTFDDADVAGRRADQRDWSLIAAVTVSALIGIAAIYWSYQNQFILTYSDGFAHINIARRIFDSRTPGLVQLGTVWLPVPHLLMMPFVYIDALWASGLAGSIVGWICFVITAAAIFLSVRLITRHEIAAWAGLSFFLTNPNVVYMQTTPMTEPVLLMGMTTSAYFLLKWSRSGRNSNTDLIIAGLLSAVAVGSRYDGWFFAGVCGVVVLLTAYRRSRAGGHAEGLTLAFAVIPIYAMFLWAFYNWTFFGDPLEFQRGEWSAQFQQQQLSSVSALPTQHNLFLSITTYTWAVLDNVGSLFVVLGVIGVVVYFFTSKRVIWNSIVPYVFLSAYPFNVLSLWTGQTVVVVPQSEISGYWNVRYGLLLLPAAAIFFAYLVDFLISRLRLRQWMIAPALALVLAAQLWLYLPGWPQSIITLTDGLAGSSEKGYAVTPAQYIREQYDGGGILIDDTNSVFIHATGLNMREYIGTFSGPLWKAALEDPASQAEWVVINKKAHTDRLASTLIDNPNFVERFRLQIDAGGYGVYRRNDY